MMDLGSFGAHVLAAAIGCVLGLSTVGGLLVAIGMLTDDRPRPEDRWQTWGEGIENAERYRRR